MLKKFLSNAMLSLVMDKQAKEKYRSRKALKQAPPEAPPDTPPGRRELIRNAMALHKEKSAILDKLSDNERRKLQLLAMRAMSRKDGGKS